MFELWPGKAFECSEPSGLFCGSFKAKTVSEDDGGFLACEVLDGSKDDLGGRGAEKKSSIKNKTKTKQKQE